MMSLKVGSTPNVDQHAQEDSCIEIIYPRYSNNDHTYNLTNEPNTGRDQVT